MDLNEKAMDIVDLRNNEEVEALRTSVTKSGEVRVIEFIDQAGEYAQGVALPRNHPTSSQYLRELREYNSFVADKEIHDQIELCRKLYIYEGVIGTALDMFIDMSFSTIEVENVADKAKPIIQYFNDNVNKDNPNSDTGVDALNRMIAFEYYIAGNVITYDQWKQVPIDNKNYRIPKNIWIFDPNIVNIPQQSVLLGGKIIELDLSSLYSSDKLMTRTNKEKFINENIPLTKIKNQARKSDKIQLDPYLVYHVKRKGSMYKGWGIPFLIRAFSAVASKRKLRSLDDATIDGMINSIIIFKVGDLKDKATMTASRQASFANLIKNPSPSNVFVFGPDLDVINISPSGEILNFKDRYADANRDILDALGIPLALLTGEGSRAGDVWASITFLIERLEDYRASFKCFLEDKYEKIHIENNIKMEKKPKVRFTKPKINKDDIRNIVLAFYERGLISKGTATYEAGYDLEVEREKRKREKKEGYDDDMIMPITPFNGQPGGEDPKSSAPKPKVKKPNPQTNVEKTNKTNIKKETKMNNISTKPSTKKRIEGSIADRFEYLIGTSLVNSNIETINEGFDLLEKLSVLYDLDDTMQDKMLIGKDLYKEIIAEASAIASNGPVIYESLDNLSRIINQCLIKRNL